MLPAGVTACLVSQLNTCYSNTTLESLFSGIFLCSLVLSFWPLVSWMTKKIQPCSHRDSLYIIWTRLEFIYWFVENFWTSLLSFTQPTCCLFPWELKFAKMVQVYISREFYLAVCSTIHSRVGIDWATLAATETKFKRRVALGAWLPRC